VAMRSPELWPDDVNLLHSLDSAVPAALFPYAPTATICRSSKGVAGDVASANRDRRIASILTRAAWGDNGRGTVSPPPTRGSGEASISLDQASTGRCLRAVSRIQFCSITIARAANRSSKPAIAP
jgi:hypothetical protein